MKKARRASSRAAAPTPESLDQWLESVSRRRRRKLTALKRKIGRARSPHKREALLRDYRRALMDGPVIDLNEHRRIALKAVPVKLRRTKSGIEVWKCLNCWNRDPESRRAVSKGLQKGTGIDGFKAAQILILALESKDRDFFVRLADVMDDSERIGLDVDNKLLAYRSSLDSGGAVHTSNQIKSLIGAGISDESWRNKLILWKVPFVDTRGRRRMNWHSKR